MVFDLSLQQYVEWEVKNVMLIKGKFVYRVILKYMDGSERPQQKAGFETEKEANAAREKTIGELYAGTYVVYANVRVKDFMEFWVEEDIQNRVGSNETYETYAMPKEEGEDLFVSEVLDTVISIENYLL